MQTPLKTITKAELDKTTAGGVDYIRTKNGIVRGLAINRYYNPGAPEHPGQKGTIAFGNGPQVKARAKIFHDSGMAVPLYVKRGTNAWEYFGEYYAKGIAWDESTIRRHQGTRPYKTAGILFIEPTTELKAQVSGGGFANPKTRKEIEVAAIKFVTSELVRRGFEVHDHQLQNRGYDLWAVSNSSNLLVEVKGTDASEPHFFLTRNENKISKEQPDWRLFVVCNARSAPAIYEYRAGEMHNYFTFDPLAWECIQRI